MSGITGPRALRDDPRIDPRLVAAFEPFGLAGPLPTPRIDASSPLDVILELIGKMEAGSSHMAPLAVGDLDPVNGVERDTVTITAPAGHEITLYVHRPVAMAGDDTADSAARRPGILHFHGGGAVMLSATDDNYVRWRDELAALGLVTVGVEFRNGAGRLGPHPFPAGLDDCAAALTWMHEHRDDLGIDALVLSGDSGGANLALATALRAKRESVDSRIDGGDRFDSGSPIDGVYALCPYVSNEYAANPDDRPADLPSLVDNDGYVVMVQMLGALATAYTPDPADQRDPLAWPGFATRDDLVGLPPHVISVNEADPLRSEGERQHARLVDAGVDARLRLVAGTVHATENNYFAVVPDIARATLADIARFARSLQPQPS